MGQLVMVMVMVILWQLVMVMGLSRFVAQLVVGMLWTSDVPVLAEAARGADQEAAPRSALK